MSLVVTELGLRPRSQRQGFCLAAAEAASPSLLCLAYLFIFTPVPTQGSLRRARHLGYSFKIHFWACLQLSISASNKKARRNDGKDPKRQGPLFPSGGSSVVTLTPPRYLYSGSTTAREPHTEYGGARPHSQAGVVGGGRVQC